MYLPVDHGIGLWIDLNEQMLRSTSVGDICLNKLNRVRSED